jgi:hypothetical protein
MTPYLGATVLVNVDASHNGGSPVAPAKVTAVHPDGTVNVRVTYDGPPSHQHPLGHHRPEWLTGVLFRDTTDPAAAMRLGQYGAFWPDGPDLAAILYNQEMIMTALQDLQAADAALKAEVATFLTDIQTALTNAGSANDPAIAQVVADINAEVAALQAADPATPAPAPAPAAPAAPVSASDTGSAA